MEDLRIKIEELKKALSGFKSKIQQNPLVPAIKTPEVKPLSMPAIRATAPIKMPGLTAPSNKDPRAVAAQLKNPKAKKSKMEILKSDKNGQWSLEDC